MNSYKNVPILDAPDQRLRVIALKRQQGQPLGRQDLERVASRMQAEAETLAKGGVVMNLGTVKRPDGSLAPGSYMYSGKPTDDEVKAGKSKAQADAAASRYLDDKEAELKKRSVALYGAESPNTAPADTGLSEKGATAKSPPVASIAPSKAFTSLEEQDAYLATVLTPEELKKPKKTPSIEFSSLKK